jgi:hypothetical protein
MNQKTIRTILFLALVLLNTVIKTSIAQQRSCALLVNATEWSVDGRTNASLVRPGDTICLLNGTRQFLWLSYLHGTAAQPIVVMNSGGVVDVSGYYYGIKIDSCSHLVFSGRGVTGLKYGVNIHDVNGVGLSIQGLSTDIEVEGLEISRTELPGIYAKSDPDTLFNSTRDKYIQRNTVIHDNYIHHTKMEGLYIGNSHYFGETLSWHGHDTVVYPHSLKGVQIYSNHIDSTGWDGIQVSSADSGCFIHHNYIYADSQLEELGQMSGVLIGGGSNCDCYNNSIMNGKGDGIDVFGQGTEFIYNNFIYQAGRNYRPADLYSPYFKVGIYAGKTQMNMPTTLGIYYNTIVYPKSYGIRFAEYPGTGHMASSNIIIGPGMYFKEGDKGFIMKENSATDFVWFNNVSSAFCKPVNFKDTVFCNFDLQPSSQAVDKGSYVPGFNIQWDFLCRWRPFARGLDIGAFECQDPSLIGFDESRKLPCFFEALVPNPADHQVEIAYHLNESTSIMMALYNNRGQIVSKLFEGSRSAGSYRMSVNVNELGSGEYHCIIKMPQGMVSRSLIISHR